MQNDYVTIAIYIGLNTKMIAVSGGEEGITKPFTQGVKKSTVLPYVSVALMLCGVCIMTYSQV